MNQVADCHGAVRIFDKESGLKEDSRKIAEMGKPKVILQSIASHVPKPTDHKVTMSTSDVAPYGRKL